MGSTSAQFEVMERYEKVESSNGGEKVEARVQLALFEQYFLQSHSGMPAMSTRTAREHPGSKCENINVAQIQFQNKICLMFDNQIKSI